MDIEGSEFFALKGMEKTLQRVRSLIIEFIPHHLENVAGVSVANFLAPITFHFDYCYVPSKKIYLTKSEFVGFFEGMYIRGESDDGLVFTTEFVEF